VLRYRDATAARRAFSFTGDYVRGAFRDAIREDLENAQRPEDVRTVVVEVLAAAEELRAP
jgi:hypothetical protein